MHKRVQEENQRSYRHDENCHDYIARIGVLVVFVNGRPPVEGLQHRVIVSKRKIEKGILNEHSAKCQQERHENADQQSKHWAKVPDAHSLQSTQDEIGHRQEQNWINRFESENFSNLINYNEHYQPGALRYEVGEHSNFILVPMMLEAIKKLNEWKPENIQQYLIDLVEKPISILRKSGFIIEETKYRASNLFGIRLAEHHQMNELKAKLLESNIIVSYRGDAIRVSPNIYNDSNDLNKLVQALTSN